MNADFFFNSTALTGAILWSVATALLFFRSEKCPIPAKRIQNIIDFLTFELFKYAARGLYEKDKLMFTLLLSLKIDLEKKNVKHEEFETLIKGWKFFLKFDIALSLLSSLYQDNKIVRTYVLNN